MLRIIKNTNMTRVKQELKRMLNDGIADPQVRDSALLASLGYEDRVTMVCEWLRIHTRYVEDPVNRELFIAPKLMIQKIHETGVAAGDCDDLALLSASMLGSLGHDVRIALLDLDGDDMADHAITQVNTKELGWFNVDISSSRPVGWEIQINKAEYVVPD